MRLIASFICTPLVLRLAVEELNVPFVQKNSSLKNYPEDIANLFLCVMAFDTLSVEVGVAAVLGALAIFAFLLLMRNQRSNQEGSDLLKGRLWEKYKPYELLAKEKLTHNTYKYRFGLGAESERLPGLEVGRHVSVVAVTAEGQRCVRSYTPLTPWNQKGHFELVVKTYEEGVMSKHLESLEVGQVLRVRSPAGKRFSYTPDAWDGKVAMLAAGTGLTPILQVLEAMVADGSARRCGAVLFFQNRFLRDVFMRDELEDLERRWPELKVRYFLSRPPGPGDEGWDEEQQRGSRKKRSRSGAPGDWGSEPHEMAGYITEKLMREYFAGAGKVLLCGPKGCKRFSCYSSVPSHLFFPSALVLRVTLDHDSLHDSLRRIAQSTRVCARCSPGLGWRTSCTSSRERMKK